MKKAIAIIVLGLLLSTSYSFAEFKFIEKGKLKVGTTQKKLKKMLFWTSPTNRMHNPYRAGCSRIYYKKSKQEILIPRSEYMFFVFENVTKPSWINNNTPTSTCGGSNGTFQALTYFLEDAENLIRDKSRTSIKFSTNHDQAEDGFKTKNPIDWGKVAEQFNHESYGKNRRKCQKSGDTFICEDIPDE